MSYSSLVNTYLPAHSSNYTKGRNGYKICKITPHIMAGNITVERCAEIFQNPSRNASSNYGIGTDGRTACYVDEEDRAWTSSNRVNDFQAITIEIANSEIGGDWKISDMAWNALVNLCVDICKRHNFRLEFDYTPNGSLTAHRMFAATACPGDYLFGRLPELARIVNERLDGNNEQPTPIAPIVNEGYLVTINTAVLNVRAGAGVNNKINTTVKKGEVYTIVEERNGWGKLKSGAGWISLNYTIKGKVEIKTQPVQPTQTNKYPLGLYVVTANALNVRTGAGTNNPVKKVYKKGTRFDTYEIKGSWTRTPSGWVCLDYCQLVRKY